MIHWFVLATLGFNSSPAQAENNDCAQLIIDSPQACANLKAHFDLSKCGDSKPLNAKPTQCKSGATEITVTGKRKKVRYTAHLKSSQWGTAFTWTQVGAIESSTSSETVVHNPPPPSEVSAVAATTAASTPTPTPSAPQAPVVVPAEAPKAAVAPIANLPLTISGNIQMRAEGDDYTDLQNTRDFFGLRIRPQFKYQADPQVTVVFEPQFAKFYGERPLTASTTTANAVTQTSGATYDTAVGFHQGFILYHALDGLDFTLGRQILSYGEELIIGASNWNTIGRSFDAFKTKWTYGFGSTDLFFSKLGDTDVTASGAGDSDLYGLYNSWAFGPGLRAVDLYGLHQKDSTTGVAQTVDAVGVRLKSNFAGTALPEDLDYRVEATKEYGNAVAEGDSAYQIDGELGYTFLPKTKTRLMAGYSTAGKNYNQLYPSPHRWLGYADVFGRRNITDMTARLSSEFGSLSTSLDYHHFTRNDASLPLYRTSGAAFPGPNSSTSNDVADEFDLVLKYKLTKTLSVSGAASYLNVTGYLAEQYSVKPSYYYVMVDMNF